MQALNVLEGVDAVVINVVSFLLYLTDGCTEYVGGGRCCCNEML